MIKGKKVILDRVEEKHLEQLLKWRNDPYNRQFYREFRVMAIENKKKWFLEKVVNDDSWQFFTVRPIDKPEKVIGSTGLTYINWVYRTAEFSITIGDKDYRGKGIGSDTLRTLIDHGFNSLNLNRIWCEVYSNNAAIDVYKRIGFKEEGLLRETVFKNGKYLDSHILSMLKSDWESKVEGT